MKKLILLLLLPAQMAFAQSEITREECYTWARENYPNLKQSELYLKIAGLKVEILKANYLPATILKGQATYQSEVTKIDIPIPNIAIPSISKDQYKVYLEFQQNIWDGGLTRAQKLLEETALKTNLSQLEIELYKLNDNVNHAWFTALLAQKNKTIFETQKSIIKEKIKVVESGIKNGVTEASNLDMLLVEVLNTDQAILELEMGYSVSVKILSLLTGKNFDESVQLKQVSVIPEKNNIIGRPELTFFESQINQLDSKSSFLDNQKNPKVFGFGQGGIGRPGLNMLSNNFDPYYLIGVGVSWTAFDWSKTKLEKQVIGLQKEMVIAQKETFEQNISILLEQQLEAIQKIGKLIESDQEIIKLREKIAVSSASKLENGTINTSDYIADLNAATVAQLKLETHKIQLNEAVIKYNTIKGKDGFEIHL